ncbi:MAG: hypothetical protein M1822_000664 [Bathelium mastoideum]|nr:MAG: hypothetical protein M1822_000664 [Bathelium mastoideum]
MAATQNWELAVPVNGENYDLASQKENGYEDAFRFSENSRRKPLSTQTNGKSRSNVRRNNGNDTRNHGKESASHLAPRQMLGRMNSDISGTSDGDSFLDYYKGNNNGQNGTGSGYNSRKHSLSEHTDFEDVDNSAWIHRDKLAKIESRELEEAGLRIGRHTSESRSNSRSTSRRGRESDTQLENGYAEVSPERGFGREQLRRLPSAEDDLQEEDEHDDYRQQTVRDVDLGQSHSFHNREVPAVRPGTSRIPLPKNSVAPVPSTHIERDAPLTRSRNNSLGNSLEDAIALANIRGRSQSGASQAVLDDHPPSMQKFDNTAINVPPSPQRGSPSKAKVPKQATPTSGARKTPNSRAASAPQKKQQRAGSNNTRDSPSKRPASSGTPSRPSTSYNRPEGEAPWIATMYKPDPRLPPDQQMLPTHAKRMMQEQWEKEGKAGAAYDRDFRIVSTHEFPPPKSPTPQNEEETELEPTSESEDQIEEQPAQRTDSAWPLAPRKLEADPPSRRPSTSGTEHGGYRITPTVQSPSLSPNFVQSPPLSPNTQQRPRASNLEHSKPSEITRLPDVPEEKGEKKSGCACCVIM